MKWPRQIGNVHDVAERYGTDAAEVWSWIALERVLVAPNDRVRVRLVAPRDERVVAPWQADDPEAEATMWIVSEVPA